MALGFSRVGSVDVTSMDRTGRGCLAGLQIVFFCVKEVKPLDLGSWSCCGVVGSSGGDSCGSVTHSAAVLVT